MESTETQAPDGMRMRCAVGDHVRYVDEHGVPVEALVTCVHGRFFDGPTWTEEDVRATYTRNDEAELAGLIERLVGQPVMAMIPCINVVYVSPDTAKRDPYGTQIERASSVQHKTQTTAHGRYWC
jgi:hypothetical protein